MSTSSPIPAVAPDEDARRAIRHDLDETLFVEAGAGAGKTTSLVDRVVNLVEEGFDITEIAAITFTEKAAAELRVRLRQQLRTRTSPAAVTALADLDHAPIGTLHAFARRILNDVPINAGLPPGFGVLDELESNLRFDDEWTELLDGLLADAHPAGGMMQGGVNFVDLCQFDGFGIQTGLRQVATGFRYNWDLVDELVDRTDPGPLVLRLDRVLALADAVAAADTPPADKQAEITAAVAELGTRLKRAEQLAEQLELLDRISSKIGKAKAGNKQNWKAIGVLALDELRDLEHDLAEAARAVLAEAVAYRKRLVGAICAKFVLDAAADRIDAGVLDFHDLLVHARRLLATHDDVRAELHHRYPRVLLDEFQDTDPIQLEIAVRLTAAPDAPDQHQDWRSLVPLPGRLFIVGDPKQSIYRFRRADIAQYLRAADQVNATTRRLTANFRSTQAVIDFTNELFERVIVREGSTQPAFQPLEACRHAHLLGHGTVSVVGADSHADLADKTWEGDTGRADELRRREACDVVGAVTTALAEGWLVEDEASGELRPCRPSDICILLPTRLSLPALETELAAVGVPYRAENAAVVYAAPEVRDLLLTLRAADDPTDELAIVAALRTPLYSCSDNELWEWRRNGGGWGIWSAPPEHLLDHPVGAALAHLRSLNARVATVTAADLLAQVADERRMFDLALAEPHARDIWRRLRFVIDQARAWADAGGRGLRRYLHWARLQASDGRVSETILPERDHDAVRLMTIHAAKGLEFPITIVSGMTTEPKRRRGIEVVFESDAWHLTGRGDDGSFEDVQPLDELMSDAERRRLLYVACTRAVDHLVVSLHRLHPDDWAPPSGPERFTSAELLSHFGAATASGVHLAAFVPTSHEPTQVIGPDQARLPVDEWRAELETTLAAASRHGAIAATRFADEVRRLRDRDRANDPGLDKHPVNIDQPPWQRGRYGTAIGRAVHGTLQFCDLADGHDIDDLAASQCAAESILGLDRTVAALARSAIQAPIVRSVVDGADHRRELFIAAPVGGRVLEGYIDLLVRTEHGLVIVDYKTDRWSGPVQTAERIERYRMQLAAYGAALEATLDETVVGGVLVRCRADELPEQIDIPDWRAAIDDVKATVAADSRLDEP